MNTVSPLRRSDDLAIDDGGAPPGGAPPQKPEDAERAIRARAAQAHDDWAAGRNEKPTPYDCDNFTDEARHDFDGCSTGTVARPVLFAKQRGDRNAIEPRDVAQAHLGDCHFLAPLAALTSTDDGRSLIHDAIKENRSMKGVVESYTVTLYRAEPSPWLLGERRFTEVRVTVAATFPSGRAQVRQTPDGDSEVWPLVFEKAFATLQGGYNTIHRGGDAAVAMEALTGRAAETFGFGWFGYSPRKLERDLAAGKMVVLNTKVDVAGGPAGLSSSHSYQVTGSCSVNGKPCVVLHNPWNKGDPEPIPFERLGDWFSCIEVGSVK